MARFRRYSLTWSFFIPVVEKFWLSHHDLVTGHPLTTSNCIRKLLRLGRDPAYIRYSERTSFEWIRAIFLSLRFRSDSQRLITLELTGFSLMPRRI